MSRSDDNAVLSQRRSDAEELCRGPFRTLCPLCSLWFTSCFSQKKRWNHEGHKEKNLQTQVSRSLSSNLDARFFIRRDASRGLTAACGFAAKPTACAVTANRAVRVRSWHASCFGSPNDGDVKRKGGGDAGRKAEAQALLQSRKRAWYARHRSMRFARRFLTDADAEPATTSGPPLFFIDVPHGASSARILIATQ